MLLTIDAGNSSTKLGVFDGEDLVAVSNTETNKEFTKSEIVSVLKEFLSRNGIDPVKIKNSIISCVVPEIEDHICGAVSEIAGKLPLVVNSSIKTGMPIIYDNPDEVGADRIVNSVAAYNRFRSSVIVVDFGTATTFDCISVKGEYLGGAIAPGIKISSEALSLKASKLPKIEIVKPGKVIGKNTVESMQSGIVYGYISLVDGLVERIRDSMERKTRVISTGGLSGLITEESKNIEFADENLTLKGLKIIMELNG